MAPRVTEIPSSGAVSVGGAAGRAVLLRASLRRFRGVTASCCADFEADRATGLGLPALRMVARRLSPQWRMAPARARTDCASARFAFACFAPLMARLASNFASFRRHFAHVACSLASFRSALAVATRFRCNSISTAAFESTFIKSPYCIRSAGRTQSRRTPVLPMNLPINEKLTSECSKPTAAYYWPLVLFGRDGGSYAK